MQKQLDEAKKEVQACHDSRGFLRLTLVKVEKVKAERESLQVGPVAASGRIQSDDRNPQAEMKQIVSGLESSKAKVDDPPALSSLNVDATGQQNAL